MAAARPQVSIYNVADGEASNRHVPLPAVFTAPIRTDVVEFVHTNMNKNKRQAYAVYKETGHETPAESWGTGRAVARIPRVPGGGTSRSGQAAFGNMCRGGRMFAPTKVWRKWHRKINQNQRRYAAVSALAASALPSLVMARGHSIDEVPELPLVADNAIESIKSTKEAVKFLEAVAGIDDVTRCKDSRKIRAGRGKLRNRRHVQRRGPLVVYSKNDGVYQSFRNIPGVDVCPVSSLGLLRLAPGGHVGRFIIFSEAAFKRLDGLYGTWRKRAVERDYNLPRPSMTNSDVVRLINSDEVQSVVNPAKHMANKIRYAKKNPLTNLNALLKLNPYAKTMKRNAQLFEAARKEAKAAKLAEKREAARKEAEAAKLAEKPGKK